MPRTKALTNYISATLLILAFGSLLGLQGADGLADHARTRCGDHCSAGRWWLARFRYGPLE